MRPNAVQVTLFILLVAGIGWAGEYDEAVKLIKQKKYGVAKTLLEATVKKDQSPKVYFALGYCHEKTGDKQKAIQFYRDSVAQNLNTKTDSDEAARALRKLMALKPEVGPVLSMAMDLESKAKEQKSEFMRQAAKQLYDFALDTDNWNLEPAAKTEPIINMGAMPARIPVDALKFDDHHYKAYVSENPVSWHEAHKNCQKVGGHLATIGTKAELDFVRSKMFHSRHYLWLGGYREGQKWKWVDGSEWTYDKWPRDTDPTHPKVGFLGIRSRNAGRDVVPAKSPHEKFYGYVCEWEK